MMDVSQIARATVNTSVVTITPDNHTSQDHECQHDVIIFSLRGAVRFAGSERLTRAIARELGQQDPQDPGSGAHANARAVVFSFRDVFSLNKVARRIIHEDISRLLQEKRTVVVIDPSDVLHWDSSDVTRLGPHVVEDQAEARDYIGGAGCRAVHTTETW
jgi:MFS superfamily sulfate permease-like transporter